MNFVVSTSALLKSLQLISGVVNSSSVLPILEDFLFEIKGGKLRVSATDLETSMSTELGVESKDNGKIAIPAKMILETLKTLSEQPLTFKVDEKTFAVEIVSETGNYKLSGENPSDFPKIPQSDDTAEVSISAAVLSESISSSLFAVSNDDLRPAMTGVLFQTDEEGTTLVATDAHKLVKLIRTDVKSPKAASFIMPKKALTLLKSSLPHSETSVKVAFNKSNAFYSFDNTNLICRLIDAQYPDYNAVIPTGNGNKLTIERLELQNALRRISIYSNKTTYQVVFSIAGSELKISAQDLDFSNEAHERLACVYEGNDMDIAFNARFLIEMLGVLTSKEIVIELSTPTRAGVIRPIEHDAEEDLLMLIMPVMINV
jgi:DNA polymerase-3 subunit beta